MMTEKANGSLVESLILVVDDEARVRESVRVILQDEGFSVLEAGDGADALSKVSSEKPDGVLLDIWMPGMDGLETLRGIKQLDRELPVVIMSGHGTIETAIQAAKLGAFDFLEKPLSIDRLSLVLRNALSQRALLDENRALKGDREPRQEFIGVSSRIREILDQVRIVAPTNASILITGENGTGKELLARSIHSFSRRANEAFVAVNCAAIPDTLIESELFGHERGAFTGATTRRMGKFDLANRGTLFLDEIGDMSLATQAKILRVLEGRVFQRVGGNRDITVDVRVIAATNKDLPKEISSGRFREDLFFRLNVFPFHLPPLRERRDDILPLLERFLSEFGALYGKNDLILGPEATAAMVNYPWPGNVRELRNVVERLVIITQDREISEANIPSTVKTEGQRTSDFSAVEGEETDYRRAKEIFEREFFTRRLEGNDWNISKTAEEVGLERSNLHRKIKYLGISKEE